MPLDRDGRRQETGFAIASLVLELSLNSEGFSVRQKRRREIRCRTDRRILTDTKSPLKDRHALLDRG